MTEGRIVQAFQPSKQTKLEEEEAKLRKKGKALIEVDLNGRLKASQARFMLEVWMMPRQTKKIQTTIVTLLWVNGETQGPGGDFLIYECPSPLCTGLILPPFRVFPKDIPGAAKPVPSVLCPKCFKTFPRLALVDSRGCTGTWDNLGKHLNFRYRQLNGDADVLKRIMHANMFKNVPDVVAGVRGSRDKYIAAQNRRDMTYFFNDHIIAESAKGVDLDLLFRNFLKA